MSHVLIYSYIVVYVLPSSPARVVVTAAMATTTSVRSLTMFLVINKSLMSLRRGFLLPILVLSLKSVDGSSHSELYIVVCALRAKLFVVVTVICGGCSFPSGCVPLLVSSHPLLAICKHWTEPVHSPWTGLWTMDRLSEQIWIQTMP